MIIHLKPVNVIIFPFSQDKEQEKGHSIADCVGLNRAVIFFHKQIGWEKKDKENQDDINGNDYSNWSLYFKYFV